MSESSFLPPTADDVPSAPALLVGAASPLWGYFMGAAASGMAWWWMTRWAEPANLEAMFGAAERAGAKAFEDIDTAPAFAPAETAIAAAPTVIEAASASAETVVEQTAAAANEVANEVADAAAEAPQLAEAVIEPILAPEPIGGEAAPISPVLATSEADPEDPEPTAA